MACNDILFGYIVEIYVQAERQREESKKKPFFVQTKRRWYPWLGEYSLENAYNLLDQKTCALFSPLQSRSVFMLIFLHSIGSKYSCYK